MILGDNIFFGHMFARPWSMSRRKTGATVFGYQVSDPERYGVISPGPDGQAW